MKKILIILAALLISGPSVAQTYDNVVVNNSLMVGSGALTVNKPVALTPGLEMVTSNLGSLTAPFQSDAGGTKNVAIRGWFDTGTTGAADRTMNGLSVETRLVAGVNGAALAFQSVASCEGTWTNPASLGGCNGGLFLSHSSRGGDVFGANSYAWCETVACRQIIGHEFNTDNRGGAGAKKGIQIVDVGTSVGTVTSAVDNVAVDVLADAGSYGYAFAFRVTAQAGRSPVRSDGAIFYADHGVTSYSGLDISLAVISSADAFIAPSGNYFSARTHDGSSTKKLIGIDSSDQTVLSGNGQSVRFGYMPSPSGPSSGNGAGWLKLIDAANNPFWVQISR